MSNWTHERFTALRAVVEEMVRAGGVRTVRRFAAFARLPGLLGLPARMEAFWSAPPPGAAVNEVGGAHGQRPGASVVDARNRCWGMPNVLVADSACWPASGWQPPTLTIMALTARACSLAAADLRHGETPFGGPLTPCRKAGDSGAWRRQCDHSDAMADEGTRGHERFRSARWKLRAAALTLGVLAPPAAGELLLQPAPSVRDTLAAGSRTAS